MDEREQSGPMSVVDPSGVVAQRERAAPEEEGCGRLLAALREVGTPLTHRRYGRRDTIYRGVEEGGALYVLTEGVARLFVSYPGYAGSKNGTFLLLKPREVFAYPVLAGGGLRRVSAEAVTECEVVKVPKVFVMRAIRRWPEVALEMATLLDLRLAEYEELVGCLLPRKVEVRLAKILLILARKFGEGAEGGGVAIKLRLTRSDLAAMTASTRESITAAVIGLCQAGILTIKSGRILLLDPERLTRIGHQ
jgi:CRP/FNR family transcriptional regulator